MAREQKRSSFSFCDRGFSLTEILVAIAIMSILAAIAVPNWSTLLPTYALNSAARQVQSELHKTKSRAVAENRDFHLVFSSTSYKIQRHKGSRYEDTGENKPLPEGIFLGNSSVKTLSFDSRGTSNGATVLANPTSSHDEEARIENMTGNSSIYYSTYGIDLALKRTFKTVGWQELMN